MFRHRLTVVAGACVASVLVTLILVNSFSRGSNEVHPVAVRVLEYLYNFETIGELDMNMEPLKVLVTDKVYDQLTIDRTERSLSVYLKFNNKPVRVEIVRADSDSILYRLITDSISPERLFQFEYKIDKGKVSEVVESEVILFPNSIGVFR